MIGTIYIEEEIQNHPRTVAITNRFQNATQIICDRYTSVFNSNAQNFRLQKKQPSLILARKHKGYVLPTPTGYGIGSDQNYYFSHMLNCLYDCRYCFLQGMYRSANYVVFVNYEDYLDEIATLSDQSDEDSWYFSGYDCDSLAMEPVTGFMDYALDRFAVLNKAHIEIRTKSTQIRGLLNRDPIENSVVAFSFSPENIAGALEHKAPTVEKRITAMQKLQRHGWKIGLRFDPVIPSATLASDYRKLFADIFVKIEPDSVHSVSYGMFRLPKPFFKKMVKLYPAEKLFSLPLTEESAQVSFTATSEAASLETVHNELCRHVDEKVIFPCS